MNRKRSFVSLLTASTFLVLAATGFLAFAQPFSIRIVGLHALVGFVFVALIGFHVLNNRGHLKRYLQSRLLWITLAISAILTLLFSWQPEPVRAVLGLSRNLGPSLDRFEVSTEGMVYHYTPASDYRMRLEVRAGDAFDLEKPPRLAIWLENASFYHIKTLRAPEEGDPGRLPYWDFKVRGWEKAKATAESPSPESLQEAELDAVSGATQNSSFDPADYILPADPENPMPYRLLIEIDHREDEVGSLVYAVDIDNADPRTFQLLELVGYPKREEDDDEGREVWALYYVDETYGPALELIDSALLTIHRGAEPSSSAEQ